MITKNNLIKKLIGMAIFQTAIILFYVSVGVKDTAGIPIISHHGSEHHQMADLTQSKGPFGIRESPTWVKECCTMTR